MPSAPKGPQPKAPEIRIGDLILDRYRVVEQIGSGGHSVVYKGQDERLSRPVCIKIFSGLGGDSGVGRTSYEHFVQEAFALSRLTHPNTLRIYDFGHLGPKEAAGMPLQVCEYMNGGTLSNIIREQGTQSLAETVRITTAMCAALSEAHALGIVHRDIKPQNILFGSVGGNRLPKLADFGIAKWSAESEQDKEQRAEDTAIVAGQKLAMYSPSWAAPEQLAGQPVSPATDIYSLACVAIYMMSGKAIFADEDVYAGYKKRRHADDLVQDTLLPLGVPRHVIAVLSRALAFDPKKRLGNVDELAAELSSALEPETEEQERLPPPPARGKSEVLEAAEPRRGSAPQPVQRGSAPQPVQRGSAPQPVQRGSAPHAVPTDYPVVERASTAYAVPEPTTPTSEEERDTPPIAVPALRKSNTNVTSETTNPLDSPRPEDLGALPSVPPAAPPIDLTPKTFLAPPVQQAWMQVVPMPQSGEVRRIALMETPQPVGDRRVQFAMIGNNTADLVGVHGAKVRVTLVPGPTGNRVVHVKGLSCFVALLGGRPSPAVVVDRSSDLALVTPRAQEIGHLRIAQGTPDGAHNVFAVGPELVGIGLEDCADPILFDFGPGSDAYFVYTRGRTVPKSGRRG